MSIKERIYTAEFKSEAIKAIQYNNGNVSKILTVNLNAES